MDPASFDAIQPLLDKLAEIAELPLGTPELHRVLSDLSQILGKGLYRIVQLHRGRFR
jgi:hypothetical protein